MKDFHNVFACYDKSKLDKVKCQKNNIYLFYMISDVKIYLHNKNVYHNVLKICKYTQEIIEMIFFVLMKFTISIEHCESI